MPRRARIDFPGAFHHVYARGIEKRDIFSDEDDRAELRRRILKNLKRFDASCLAWAFMSNHFHMLFRSEAGNLPKFMRCLMSGYSIYFNRKYGRTGHLFQNRYKSAVIDTERYLLELIRYIHLNPLRSGFVSSLQALAGYRWTGHREIIESGNFPWDKYPFIKEFFTSRYLSSMELYISFLEEGLRIHPNDYWNKDITVETNGYCMDKTSDKGEDADPPRIFLDILGKASRKHEVSTDRILNGHRGRNSTRARRDILIECVCGKRMDRSSVCKWLGISKTGSYYHLKVEPHDKWSRGIGSAIKQFKNVPGVP